jgi:hypothetical protein
MEPGLNGNLSLSENVSSQEYTAKSNVRLPLINRNYLIRKFKERK